MLEGTLVIPDTTEVAEEEIRGEKEFSLREIFRGILAGGKDFADELEAAIQAAELETL